jgi:hypothetical protein
MNTYTTKASTKTLLDVRKENGLVVNADVTKYRPTFVFRHRSTGQSRNKKIANRINTYFENVAVIKLCGNNSNKPKLHSRNNQEHVKLGKWFTYCNQCPI